MLNLPGDDHKHISEAVYQAAWKHRGCLPGIIQTMNDDGTVRVTLALTDPIIDENGVRQDAVVKDLDQVPLAVLGATGFWITVPVNEGDECLLLFQDVCIDQAWQASGTGNPQIDKRRHDLRDAICLPLSWTQQTTLDNYSQDSIQIRDADQNTLIDISDGDITIKTTTSVTITAPSVKMGSSGGTPQVLMTNAFYQYFVTKVYPFLTGLGFTGGPAPTNSITTATEGD